MEKRITEIGIGIFGPYMTVMGEESQIIPIDGICQIEWMIEELNKIKETLEENS